MLFVTHDIDEAIYMSDRIVIMTQRPGKIEQIIPVEIERPSRSQQFRIPAPARGYPRDASLRRSADGREQKLNLQIHTGT
jgi:ABC-type nitrate/sulfonate/bicarbonate transport system ATPase subunit